MTELKAHALLDCMGKEITRKTAQSLGWKITKFNNIPCEHCAVGKARQKNLVQQSTSEKATRSGEMMFTDISSIKQLKNGPPVNKNKHWSIVVDEYNGTKVSNFYPTKNAMVQPLCAQLNKWKEDSIIVKEIRLDNAGENKTLQRETA